MPVVVIGIGNEFRRDDGAGLVTGTVDGTNGTCPR
jgi:Ni,Fe-hydrogenase maturation factor